MKRFNHLVLALIVSPEMVIGVAVLAFALLAPTPAANLGSLIRSDAEVWSYLPVLTFIFSGAAIRTSFKLRAPLESSYNRMLYQWPGYQLLVDRVYVGLFYGISSAGASLFLWMVGKKLEPLVVASIFLASTLMAGATALTMLLAQQKLRELLEANI